MNVRRTAELIKKHEGLRLKPYFCSAKKLTLGYGRNIEENGITNTEADFLLSNDILNATNEIIDNFCWFSGLNDDRQSVIVNMVFNLGMPRFKGFKKLISAIEEKEFTKASVEMLNSKWATQVGERATELADAMENGFF